MAKFKVGDKVWLKETAHRYADDLHVYDGIGRELPCVAVVKEGLDEDGEYHVALPDNEASYAYVTEDSLEPYTGQDGGPASELAQPESDPVNHPAHYVFSNGAEVIDITEHLSFNGGNAVKYVARATRVDGKVKGNVLEDLKKAAFYVAREIERIEKEFWQ